MTRTPEITRATEDLAYWRAEHERRNLDAYRRSGCSEPLARALLEKATEGIDDWTVATDGTGWAAVSVSEENGVTVGRIHDLTLVDGPGWAERWCSLQGALKATVRVHGGDSGPGGTDAGLAGYSVLGQTRIRFADQEPLLPAELTVRALTEAEYPQWCARREASYLADIVRTGALSAEEARRKSDRDFARILPQGFTTPDHAFWILESGDDSVGTGWVRHRWLPGVTYGFSLEVYAEHRGRGFGRAALAVGEWAARQGGDEAMMFNVFGRNTVAMSLYDSAGYVVLEEHRSKAL